MARPLVNPNAPCPARRRRLSCSGVTAAALAAAVLTAQLTVAPAHGQGSVRAWGMAGAHTASARGLGAVEYNPANLAFSPGTSIGIASAAVDVRNNAFSLERYNELTGATLTTADKNSLLADIPEQGLRLDGDLRTSLLGYHSGNLAISMQAMAAGRGNLDRDFFDLVLFGNEVGETVDFSDTHGDGHVVGAMTLSYGRPVAGTPLGQISAGLNVRYLRGFYEMHVENAGGELNTSIDALSGSAMVSALTAEGGQGYAVDLGLALQSFGGWTFGLAVDNALSQLRWDRNPERYQFSASADSLHLTQGDMDAAFVTSDTTEAAEPYTTTMPFRMRLGASNRIGDLLVAVDWVQGFVDRSGTSRSPQLSAGLEWGLSTLLTPRFGLSVGGPGGSAIAGGLGARIGFWRLDLALLGRGGFSSGSSRGLGLAAGTSLEF